jgi:GTP-binding protein
MVNLESLVIANVAGKVAAYALWNLQERGRLMLGPQTEVYEGMVVGIHSRENNWVVNVTKEKQLTNVRASGTDENIQLIPYVRMSLE